MDDYYWKRSGEIPGFGNWDTANELPITQYFENARQAGLIRYSSSSGDSDPYVRDEHDLYAVEFKKQVGKATRIKDRRYTHAMVNDKETRVRKQCKVYDVTEHPRKQTVNKNKNKVLHVNYVVQSGHQLPLKQDPQPVDEDLYKIPPELLRTTKRKKMFGFISKCLVPAACVS